MFFFNHASMSSINLNPWPILPQILLVAKLYQGFPGSQKELVEVALEQLVADLYKNNYSWQDFPMENHSSTRQVELISWKTTSHKDQLEICLPNSRLLSCLIGMWSSMKITLSLLNIIAITFFKKFNMSRFVCVDRSQIVYKRKGIHSSINYNCWKLIGLIWIG